MNSFVLNPKTLPYMDRCKTNNTDVNEIGCKQLYIIRRCLSELILYTDVNCKIVIKITCYN